VNITGRERLLRRARHDRVGHGIGFIIGAAFASLVWLLPQIASAQPEEYNHPELRWQLHETGHFKIYYHQGAERTARELAAIAEDVYEPITSLYDYYPDSKTSVIVRDHDDYSNGGAYYYDNKILIWATALDFDLRGTHNWLRNVMTHEFTHLIQLGASRKGPRWLPAFYAQWIEYEEEKRPDVLYGYPNVLASYPLPMTIVPPWFAEGCSQTQKPGLGYDHWDSHRDMLLRMRVLDDKLLTYTEMGYYGKISLDAESVYNQGYSLVRYIADRWGAEKLQALSKNMRSLAALSFDHAVKKQLGISGSELYRQWAGDLKKNYSEQTATISANAHSGGIIEKEGFANLYPCFSPDGKHLAFTSNKGSDYFFTSGLYLYDVEKDTAKLLKAGVVSPLSFSPDGRFIFYHKQFGPGKHGSHFDDIAAWDLHAEKEIRLTEGRRASQINISRDGKQICFVVNSDGSENLWVADLPEDWWQNKGNAKITNELALTHYSNGEQVHAPKWSLDGNSIIYAMNRDNDRDILISGARGGEVRLLIGGKGDQRDAVWENDQTIYYSSDETGIFNLYRFDLTDSSSMPVSNVLGGAFMPSVSADGKLAYAEYRGTGYKLALMDSIETADPQTMSYILNYSESLPAVLYSIEPAPDVASKWYKPSFDKTFIFPRLAMDFGTFKPGLYFYFQDILEQMSAFGGFAINTRGDYDLFALVDYKRMAPTIFVEAYNLRRHTSESFEDPFTIMGETGSGANAVPIYDSYSIDYNFNLLEVDVGARLKLKDEIGLRLAGILSRYRTNLTLEDGLVFGYTYFKGKAVEATLTADYRAPGRHEDIAPSGGHYLQVKAAREFNDFIDGFEVNADAGTLEEVYTRYEYDRFQLLGDKYLASPIKRGHAMTLTADLGFIDHSVDGFFHLYAGGLDGMKGYSFYSLGGTRKAIARAAYNLPLWIDAAKNLGIISIDKVYLQAFGDVGNAWTGDPRLRDWADDLKKDAGAGLKVQFYSFTTFPTAASLDAAYGFDGFQVTDDNGIHDYGREWRFYFTLLFNFNLRQSLLPRGRH
jgi:Tol biopolymer transport system component